MMTCTECLMVFNPELADTKPTDERGGIYTGWILPPGKLPPRPHVHDFDVCARQGCGEYVDASDGTFCSDYCRDRAVKESGE